MRLLPIIALLALFAHPFGASVIVVNYELRKAEITEMFCVNKATPEMQCNGKCHLKKQLEEESENSQSPAATTETPSLWAVQFGQTEAPKFPVSLVGNDFVNRYAESHSLSFLLGVFHPPQV